MTLEIGEYKSVWRRVVRSPVADWC